MPTEPTSRYFQVASMERGVRLNQISGAENSAVASTATQSRPRCWARIARAMAPGSAVRQETNTRLGRSVRRLR